MDLAADLAAVAAAADMVMAAVTVTAAAADTPHIRINRRIVYLINHRRCRLFRLRLLTLYTMNISTKLFRCAARKKFAIIYILSFRSEVS